MQHEKKIKKVKRLFLLAFDNSDNDDKKFERDSHRKYFLPRVNITNYKVLINDRNFYDQPIDNWRFTLYN